jgi:hypothetical protein
MNRTDLFGTKKFDDNYAIGHLENDELNPKKNGLNLLLLALW